MTDNKWDGLLLISPIVLTIHDDNHELNFVEILYLLPVSTMQCIHAVIAYMQYTPLETDYAIISYYSEVCQLIIENAIASNKMIIKRSFSSECAN